MATPSRRQFLQTSAGGMLLALAPGGAPAQSPDLVENPYAGVDWDTWQTLDSMSHQHQGQTDTSRAMFYAMGYRHLAFSNYYPSCPTPLSESFASAHPDALGCPNAEHHSFTDSGLHANGLGSLTVTGDGKYVPGSKLASSPLTATFQGLSVRGTDRPWEAIYRIDVGLASLPGQDGGRGKLTIEGGVEASPKDYQPVGDGLVRERERTGSGSVVFRALRPDVTITLTFDPKATKVTQFRLMQGSYRPWRDVFRSLLDGDLLDGAMMGGLQFPDGGGITLNHPTSTIDAYLPQLDHDPRVLGIEIWNHNTTGFGSTNGLSDDGPGPQRHFYDLWDAILSTGRRCLGFCVKDHWGCGRGRNVLLVPPAAGKSRLEREHEALVAYRQGAFCGTIGACNLDASGALVNPFDQTGFRLRRLEVAGRTVTAEVGGQDVERRPQVQFRFVTDQGVEKVVDGPAGEFATPAGRKYVRVEAFAYPKTQRGEALTPATVREMDVWALSQVHDRALDPSVFSRGGDRPGTMPMGTADLLFCQPIRWRD